MLSKVDEILSLLTLEEKAALTSGINFWETTPIYRINLDGVKVADGPHGLRVEEVEGAFGNIMQKSKYATCFPPAVTVASTWDKTLAYEMGEALADEAKELGISTVLGPGCNIKRNPLCGRNFEYYSEDPYLSGQMAEAYINGCEQHGVGTSLKHFAVNSQEWRRMVCSSEVDERALRELYLVAFENAVKKAQPWTVMCSYNPINGVHASDNKRLLTDILRDEWGFDGLVISDWGAVNDRVSGIKAGMDLEMPGCDGINDKVIVEAVKNGTLKEEELDVVVRRILTYILKCLEQRFSVVGHKSDSDKNHHLARRIATAGCVLLKNQDNILPLNSREDFLVVGKFAKKPRYQGTGSSQINPKRLVSFTEELDNRNIKFDYAQGYSDRMLEFRDLKNAAMKKAEDKNLVIVFAGLTENDESEACDREHMRLGDDQNELITSLCDAGKKVVVVLAGGACFEMPWIDKVHAVLHMQLAGEAVGEATADVLFGRANPCGKLAETYPYKYDDLMANKYYKYGPKGVEYRESIFVGYRYYDAAKKDVMFPFGYGLSYTNYEYSNITISAPNTDLSEDLEVTVDIKNVGRMAGYEIAQLYIHDKESTVFRPEKELKGFEKVYLEPEETKTVKFSLDKRAFAFYNTEINDWTIEAGAFDILVGASSRDIRQTAVVEISAPAVNMPDYKAVCPVYYNLEGVTDISDEEWVALKGAPLCDNSPTKVGDYDFNTTVGECEGSWFARLFRWIFVFFAKRAFPKDAPSSLKKMAIDGALSMPVRNFYAMSMGIAPYKTALYMLEALNGKPFSGLIKAGWAFLSKDRKHTKKKVYGKK